LITTCEAQGIPIRFHLFGCYLCKSYWSADKRSYIWTRCDLVPHDITCFCKSQAWSSFELYFPKCCPHILEKAGSGIKGSKPTQIWMSTKTRN